jgi:hypothetical protein
LGLLKDGSLRHSYDESWNLLPLGHWNWKWTMERGHYHSYEQEILAGILTLASQKRIIGHLPII